MSRHAGLPLLSGPPPPHPGPDQRTCRKCNREFTLLFHRQRKCMHCGYGYCSSCTDYQALVPRSGPARGYDSAHVCAFCIELLNVTSLGRPQLRSLPIAKLRRYIAAYNISVKNPVDKNDLVDAAVAARTFQGCLSPVNEDYYRKHSVPSFSDRSSSPRTNSNSSARSNRQFPRPDLDPNRQHPQETTYSTGVPRPRTTSAPTSRGTTRPTSEQPDISRPAASTERSSTPRTTSANHSSSHSQTAPPLPPPPMSTLVTLPRSSFSALSVGTLKQILFEARVRVPPGVVEKEELVERVWALVEEEKRKDNEDIHDVGSEMYEDDIGSIEELDRDEQEIVETADPESEAHVDVAHEHTQENDHYRATTAGGRVEGDRGMTHERHQGMGFNSPSSRSPTPQRSVSPLKPSTSPLRSASKSKPRPQPNSTSSGLCVVCQDEEATIAIVDCGHLAMCRECSDLVLSSSRECPLCRTRIVTEARLLRIYKT